MTLFDKAPTSWLFVGGVDESELNQVPHSGAHVAIQDLEDFTPPERRNEARTLSPRLMEQWRAAKIITAVRVNPLELCGIEDLESVMPGNPDFILLPKVAEPDQILELVYRMELQEKSLALPAGQTKIVPNLETARGVMQTYAIATCSPRITACLLAAEDLATDLGAERGRDGLELAYARQRFLLECRAAKVLPIDCPYTWTDLDGLETDCHYARRLGYEAKSVVSTSHVKALNAFMRPTPDQIAAAHRIVEAFETAQSSGFGRVEVDGSLIEVPIYFNAKRLLNRL